MQRSLYGQLHTLCQTNPDAVAVDDGRVTLTYGELFAGACGIATAINKTLGPANASQPQAVGLLMDHGSEAICGLLGCVFAGRCYLPLDTAFPEQRLRQYLNQASLSCLVTQTNHIALAQRLVDPSISLLNIDHISSVNALDEPAIDLELPAYLLYTSGSTGEPKGIWHDQASVLRSAQHYQADFAVCEQDRVALILPLQYTPSIFCVFGGLLAGASVHAFDLRRDSVSQMITWTQEQAITLLYTTPTIFRRFMREVPQGTHFEHLRFVQVAGEPLYRADVRRYLEFSGSQFGLYNGMGTTETSCLTRYFVSSLDDFSGDVVPIGTPYDDVAVDVLDEAGNSLSGHAVGELRVSGSFLARGYWSNTELTDASFLRDVQTGKRQYKTGDLVCRDDHGHLIYLGRKDSQIKIKGQRVELGEIESTLLKHPAVREAVILYDPDAAQPLAAYFTPVSDVAALRRWLSRQLPPYMVPTRLVPIDQLPTTTSGKVDRHLLDQAEHTNPGISADVPNEQEMQVLKAFRAQFKQKELGIDSDFFALGGDSLEATALVLELAESGIVVDASSLIEAPSPRQLAASILSDSASLGLRQLAASAQTTRAITYFPGQGMSALSFRDAANQLSEQGIVFGFDYHAITGQLRRSGRFSIARLAAYCVEQLPRSTEHVLIGFSVGGVIALEVAHQLQGRGEHVAKLVLLDCYTPMSLRVRALKRRLGRRALLRQLSPTDASAPMTNANDNALEWAACRHRSKALTLPEVLLIKATRGKPPPTRWVGDYAQWRKLLNATYTELGIDCDHNELARSHLSTATNHVLEFINKQPANAPAAPGSLEQAANLWRAIDLAPPLLLADIGHHDLLSRPQQLTKRLKQLLGEELQPQVYTSQLNGHEYIRHVVLRTAQTQKAVVFAILRIQMNAFGARFHEHILDLHIPFGDLLTRHQIKYRCDVNSLFTLQADAALSGFLSHIPIGTRLSGRHNVFVDPTGRLLADVVEVLSTLSASSS